MKSLTFLFISFLAFSNLYAQTEYGELNIATITSQSLRLPHVTIELFLNDTTFIKSTKTDANGRVQIDSLNEGTYSIKASKEEYYGIDHYKVPITIGPRNYVTINLTNIEEERKRLEEENRCDYDLGTEKPTCHICQSSKDVVPVMYGLPSEKGLEAAREGRLIFGGCMKRPCSARWYCTKDEVGILLKK